MRTFELHVQIRYLVRLSIGPDGAWPHAWKYTMIGEAVQVGSWGAEKPWEQSLGRARRMGSGRFMLGEVETCARKGLALGGAPCLVQVITCVRPLVVVITVVMRMFTER